MQKSLIPDILKKIAPKFGAEVFTMENSEVVGQIQFPNGVRKYFLYGSIDINTTASAELAGNKYYASHFLSKKGYSVAKEIVLYAPDEQISTQIEVILSDAEEFANLLGYPIIVKPNERSQGIGVIKVHSNDELRDAIRLSFRDQKSTLIQEYLPGRDYRVVVLGDSILDIYERIPLNVVGDGKHNIASLLRTKQEQFIDQNRNTVLNMHDIRILNKLQKNNLSFESVPLNKEVVYLLDNANLSTGGECINVEKLHPAFKDIAVMAVREVGLKFGGVDFIINEDINKAPEQYWILEINASPDLENNFPINKKHIDYLERCYSEIFQVMARDATVSYE